MSHLGESLLTRCHVSTNRDGDCFVGIKITENGPEVHFPLGYYLPQDEKAIRREILSLLAVLDRFGKRCSMIPGAESGKYNPNVNIPILVCLEIIRDFFDRGGFFTEREYAYKTDTHGKIIWNRTVKKIRPIPTSDFCPVYTRFIVKHSPPAENNLITQIHMFCLRECFLLLGWLFTAYIPPAPKINFNKDLFLHSVNKKINSTNNDKDKKLMILLKAFIEKKDFLSFQNMPICGTETFEYVWEDIIDKIFGNRNKKDYFPQTHWLLRVGTEKTNDPLEPDTIMAYHDNIYVLDAKYYKFGMTANPWNLPESSSIHKQITYGEYVAQKNYAGMNSQEIPVFNAFLMPYNAHDNKFSKTGHFENIGEAISDWKTNLLHKYEHVQGILIDTSFLLHTYIEHNESAIAMLADAIETSYAANANFFKKTDILIKSTENSQS